jgi:hypothetical protein
MTALYADLSELARQRNKDISAHRAHERGAETDARVEEASARLASRA